MSEEWKVRISQWLNVLLFGRSDQMLSSRIYLNSKHSVIWNVVRVLVDILFLFWGQNHCEESHFWEIEEMQKEEWFVKEPRPKFPWRKTIKVAVLVILFWMLVSLY